MHVYSQVYAPSQAAANLKDNGANRVFAFASHGLFSGPASDRIDRSVLEEVVVTNTIPLKASAKTSDKIKQVQQRCVHICY